MVNYNSGIYKIVNLINNKVYIGSTYNIYKRGWEHFNYPDKSNPILQKSMIKHGKNNFRFEILEEFKFSDNYDKNCKREYIEGREQYYMDLYECYNLNKGYNISKTAGKPTKPTKESAAKGMKIKRERGYNKETYPTLSTSKVGNLNPMYNKKGSKNPLAKKVYQYSLNGDFVKEYGSIVEASIEVFGKSKSHISQVCNNKRNHCGGYIWKYK